MSFESATIQSLCSRVASGGTPSRSNESFWEGGSIPWLKTGELNDARISNAEERITEEALQQSSAKIFPENTILMAMYGDGKTITTLGILDAPCSTNQACAAMIADPDICDYRYLFYALKRERHKLLKLVVAGAQRNLSLGIIKKFEVPCPELAIQKRIATVLTTYDDLTQNNRRRIALLEEAARLLYREWFVHLRFPGHEHVKIIDGVPEGWEPGNVGALGLAVTGKTPSKKVEANFGADLPFIKTPDMHGNVFVIETEESLSDLGAKTQENKTLPIGSVLVSCIGTVGAVAMNASPAQTNQQINAVIPKHSHWQFFAFFALKAIKPRLEAMGGGATMANVNKTKFESVPILLPLDE